MSLTLAIIHHQLYRKTEICCSRHIRDLLLIGLDGYEDHVDLKRKRLRKLIMNEITEYEIELDSKIKNIEQILQMYESLDLRLKTYKIGIKKTEIRNSNETDMEKQRERDQNQTTASSIQSSSTYFWLDVAKKIDTERSKLKSLYDYLNAYEIDFPIDDHTSVKEFEDTNPNYQYLKNEKEKRDKQEQELATINHRETALSYLKFIRDAIHLKPKLPIRYADIPKSEAISTETVLTGQKKLSLACEAYEHFLNIHLQNEKVRLLMNLIGTEQVASVKQTEIVQFKADLERAQQDYNYCGYLATKFLDDSSNLLPVIENSFK